MLRSKVKRQLAAVCFFLCGYHLFEGALFGAFLWPPAQEFCAVAEAASGEVIVLDFAD
jgi:hypothetical protein